MVEIKKRNKLKYKFNKYIYLQVMYDLKRRENFKYMEINSGMRIQGRR